MNTSALFARGTSPRWHRTVLAALLLLSGPALAAQAAGLESRLAPLIEAHQGRAAVAVRHLETGEDVRCDAGIIDTPGGPVAVCVLTADNADRRWTADNAGNLLCAEVGRAVYAHFQPAAAPAARRTSDEPGVLKAGSGGKLVEDLQRTLNARLEPSPRLGVDGDFGPATRAAVVRFQEAHGLTADGVVRRETWEALGPLVTDDPAVPDPEAVNGEELTLLPPEDLDGPPFVTCKAWAVGDGRTGELLWGAADDEPRHMASTTKIMTAWIVIQLAGRDGRVLDESVTFSRRAAGTIGSSAALRAGERLPVRELLYGLMLPSGNDASVALAEHFGPRFDPPEGGSDTADGLERFVAEMNRTAARLGLDETRYANPHGLTHDDHHSSARDLLKLAWTAMQDPLFRQYVGTRQRGCCVTGPGGYRRNVVWKNTNELLGMQGYAGVKTGTTSAAGACLVSSGRRGDDELFVVVLGSSSPDARYVDTRNLFRWSWRQRTAADH